MRESCWPERTPISVGPFDEPLLEWAGSHPGHPAKSRCLLQSEFEHGSVDRGRTIFEGLISSNPR